MITKAFKEFKQFGYFYIQRKAFQKYEKIVGIFYFFPALFSIFIFELLGIFIKVRVQTVDIGRIGHSYNIFLYLIRKKLSIEKKVYLDLFSFFSSTGIVCNKQYRKMLKRELYFVPCNQLIEQIQKLSRVIFQYDRYALNLPTYEIEGQSWYDCAQQTSDPLLEFSSKENELGRRRCLELGLPDGEKFICFHVRDSAYLNKIAAYQNWSYHDFRDASLENSVIALEKFCFKNKIYAIRMGSVTTHKVNSQCPYIIDYANSPFQSDFMDLYLSANCKFFVGSDSGLSMIPELFGKPMIYLNIAPLAVHTPFGHYVICLYKKFFHVIENVYITYSDLINKYVGKYPSTESFKNHNLELIENSAEEIYDVIVEMNDSLSGINIRTDEDLMLQKQFWDVRGGLERGGKVIFVGTKFLRMNRALIGGIA